MKYHCDINRPIKYHCEFESANEMSPGPSLGVAKPVLPGGQVDLRHVLTDIPPRTVAVRITRMETVTNYYKNGYFANEMSAK